MNTEKTIDALNTLIVINNDRIEGYQTATNESEEIDLKLLFGKLMQTSMKCKEELTMEITALGGKPNNDTLVTGKFFRVWMDVKAAITGKDRKSILDSCEYGEDVAVDTYETVLSNHAEHLNATQVKMITAQHLLLKADHDTVKHLRDTTVEHAK
ncbi:MAG: ferritin-like domain-containing protein [Cytophagales bacterium]